ncbi:AbgT family transporter [Henriciella pelagia]|jgi:aminobenzoyl-glutamate transport protein|uniref:Membrane protein n=1 Tax=Henriciella pelagia TaxID=1977912 RepID=A0ABQ1J984_9PROT|nr:AbgT family transporter [Henriciella pelagia]GGB63204.1 membrane protein [Henriciella pelagia]
MSDQSTASVQKGFLGWVEKTGNKLPDPVFIFFYLIIALMIISQICAWLDVSAFHPSLKNPDGTPQLEEAVSLFAPENIQRLWVEMPATFTHFHPLGYVLVVMLGAGVAERSGLFGSAIRAAVRGAPKAMLTPLVALIAMLSNHAADAGYVVMIPLAAIIFASAGRHPLAGIAAAFAGVSGGFSANITPGQLDALLFGITESAYGASNIDAGWAVNFAGNWYFIGALLFIYLPVIWFVTDKVIEPRLGKWKPDAGSDMQNYGDEDKPLTEGERKGLGRAGLAILGVAALWVFMTVGPGTPLLADGPGNEDAAWYVQAGPLFRSLVAAFLIIFLAAGWAYGSAAGTIKNHRDLVEMMASGMKDMAYYLVLAFAAAHFVAMFGWSNLGLITAVHGADAIQNSGLPLPVVLGLIVLFSAALNLFVGSASAKWALLAPVLVPMLMLVGISPDGATAAYRVGDGATNIITPLMVYFPLILVFAQRWQKNFGLGSLTAMMIPYSVWMLITGVILMMVWLFLGIDLGPGAPAHMEIPGSN